MEVDANHRANLPDDWVDTPAPNSQDYAEYKDTHSSNRFKWWFSVPKGL
jgi:hypothetical protein